MSSGRPPDSAWVLPSVALTIAGIAMQRLMSWERMALAVSRVPVATPANHRQQHSAKVLGPYQDPFHTGALRPRRNDHCSMEVRPFTSVGFHVPRHLCRFLYPAVVQVRQEQLQIWPRPERKGGMLPFVGHTISFQSPLRP